MTGLPAASADAVSPRATENASRNCLRQIRQLAPKGAAKSECPAWAMACGWDWPYRCAPWTRNPLRPPPRTGEAGWRADHLALQTLLRQSSFLVRSLEKLLRHTFHAMGDMAQEPTCFFAWQFSIDGKCLVGELRGELHILPAR